MSEWKSANLIIEQETEPWTQVEKRVSGWSKDMQNAFAITQSFTDLKFTELAGASLDDLPGTFSGRIFNAGVEVRWLRDADKGHVWRLSENGNGKPIRCEFFDRRYYIRGECYRSEGLDAFWEGRMPSVRRYPIHAKKEHDRAYIIVREYRPAEPDFKSTDPEALMNQLNQPRLLAHRFMSVGVGQQDA